MDNKLAALVLEIELLKDELKVLQNLSGNTNEFLVFFNESVERVKDHVYLILIIFLKLSEDKDFLNEANLTPEDLVSSSKVPKLVTLLSLISKLFTKLFLLQALDNNKAPEFVAAVQSSLSKANILGQIDKALEILSE